MEITTQDIINMVTESVKKILSEKMNILNEELFPLAEKIYDIVYEKVSNEEYNFKYLLNLETIKQFYPYQHPQSLSIIGEFFNGDKNNVMMLYKNNSIVINLSNFFGIKKEKCCANISHELTHFVNDCEGNIPIERGPLGIYEKERKIRYLLYFLRDTECNARCTQFGYYLKNNSIIGDIDSYEDITRLQQIELLLNEISKYDINIKIFNNKTLNLYRKKYNKYKQKIFKIYYYFLEEKK